MIEGIKIAVTSYKDSEESANLAAQISFFIAKERKNQVFLIVNTEYDLIDKMRGRTELNDVTVSMTRKKQEFTYMISERQMDRSR